MAGKRYYAKRPDEIPNHPYEIVVYRGGVEEVHEFNAKPSADLGPMIAMYRNADDAIKMGESAIRLMLKQLDDSDGVSITWAPTIVPKPKNAGPDYEPKFRAPLAPHGDGRLHPMTDQDRWLDLDKGSSRRRWQHLMIEDDGVSIDAEVLMEIMSDVIEAAMDGRPTPA
ncbi:MAG TPA: hypothetical protein VGH72_33960 [Pseudonocardia sp.]|jgi:hypothetical protein